MWGRVRSWSARQPWLWAVAGAVIVWAITTAVAQGRGAFETLSSALQFATFYAIVGVGQMFVIASGPGNIDLSIPAVMTLAGYLAMGVMHGGDAGLWPGLAAGVGVGLAAGIANVVLIRGLGIPPMIATLAAGFVEQSITMAYSRGSTAKPAPALLDFAAARIAGVPVIAILFGMLGVLTTFLLRRSTFGRTVLAAGQNRRAAYLAGLPVERTTAAVYVLSAVLASVSGMLLSAYSGGAALDMAGDFLLMSIAVVVLGGTSIAGGQASVAGVWGGAVLLYLIVTMLNVMQVEAGLRFIISGLIIIGVLALAEGKRAS
jgi:ribose transport system permease protein